MGNFTAGVLAIVLIAVASFFGLTRTNPFADPFTVKAVFDDSAGLDARSPVRIAGIDVGKVAGVRPLAGGRSEVELELEPRGLPLHTDAELMAEPRVFFEGSFFVDLSPGSPSAPELEHGELIPREQTSTAVRFGDVLSTLEADTRADLQTLLREVERALDGGGARGLRRTIPQLEPAYRDLSLVSDALLGLEPLRDLGRGLRGTQRTVAALAEDERALRGLVSGAAATFHALAREDRALAASVPALRDALRTGHPALASLNGALPELRSFARAALPGVRRLAPATGAALPFLRQARALVSPVELPRTARALRRSAPRLVRLVEVTVPLLGQLRAASRCVDRVLVPFITSDFPDPDFPANSGSVNHKVQRSFVGLAGESRMVDANQSFFHASVVPAPTRVRPAPPPDGGSQPPPRRPDIPCETQDPPNLEAPVETVVGAGPQPSLATRRRALSEAGELVGAWQRRLERRRARILRREARP